MNSRATCICSCRRLSLTVAEQHLLYLLALGPFSHITNTCLSKVQVRKVIFSLLYTWVQASDLTSDNQKAPWKHGFGNEKGTTHASQTPCPTKAMAWVEVSVSRWPVPTSRCIAAVPADVCLKRFPTPSVPLVPTSAQPLFCCGLVSVMAK